MRIAHEHKRHVYRLSNGIELDLARGAVVEGEMAALLYAEWPARFRPLGVTEPLVTGEAPADELLHK